MSEWRWRSDEMKKILYLKWKCQSWIPSENDETTLSMIWRRRRRKEMESDIFTVFMWWSKMNAVNTEYCPTMQKKKSLIISIRKIEIGIKDLTTYLTFCFNLCKYVQLVLTRYAACREIKRFCCAQYLTDSTLNTVAMKNRWSKNFWETRNLDRKLQGKKCS